MGAPAIAILFLAVSLGHADPTLAHSSSDQFRKVDEIVGIASENGCASAVAILRARYATSVSNAYCQPEILKTSLPAKQLLTITLEGTPYSIYVVAHPARRPGAPRTPEALPKQDRHRD